MNWNRIRISNVSPPMRALSFLLVVGVLGLAQSPDNGDARRSKTNSSSAFTDQKETALALPTHAAFVPPNRLVKSEGENIPRARPDIGIDENSHFRPGWLKKLTIESFGYGPAPLTSGFDLSPGYTSALFNLNGLECPGCVRGPVNRPQFTLPPFGANATLKLRDGRIELFTGFGAIEAWRPTGTFMNDAWLTQVQFGGRVAMDRNRHLWLGGTGRSLYNFGPGPKHWNTFSGDATFRFGR